MSAADNLPHRRRNPLTGEWVTVSPQRVARPWQGEETAEASTSDTAYDPECYLCPGNTRVTGACNPDYAGPWAFDNDFPALHDAEATPVQSELLPVSGGDPELFTASPVAGRCRVLCYHPDHRKTLSTLSRDEASAVVALWVEEVRTLRLQYQWVQVVQPEVHQVPLLILENQELIQFFQQSHQQVVVDRDIQLRADKMVVQVVEQVVKDQEVIMVEQEIHLL